MSAKGRVFFVGNSGCEKGFPIVNHRQQGFNQNQRIVFPFQMRFGTAPGIRSRSDGKTDLDRIELYISGSRKQVFFIHHIGGKAPLP